MPSTAELLRIKYTVDFEAGNHIVSVNIVIKISKIKHSLQLDDSKMNLSKTCKLYAHLVLTSEVNRADGRFPQIRKEHQLAPDIIGKASS